MHDRLSVGIIPACTGSTRRPDRRSCSRWDHPRMYGEHHFGLKKGETKRGSSPHVRGARRGNHVWTVYRGIIPACTGSTPSPTPLGTPGRDHPRMYGEHSTPYTCSSRTLGSSPHVRGALRASHGRDGHVGIIPACTGSTVPASTVDIWSMGSSPHVRGAHKTLE